MTTTTQTPDPVFSIEKIYVKDLSVEVPNAPGIFLEREQPSIEVQMENNATSVEKDIWEVSITVKITAQLGERVVFLTEVQQAAVFQISGIPEEYMESVIHVDCPGIIYPYLRETVSDVINRAGFPPVILTPVNFQALLEQKKANEKKSPIITS